MYWNCPKCKAKVDFAKQMSEVFEENGEAEFDPKRGLYFHTIECNNTECNATWVANVSAMGEDDV